MKKGYFLVLLTAIISGFSIFINKFGVSVINPNIYTFLRVLTVAIFSTGLLLFLKEWRKLKNLKKREWLLLIIIGLTGGSIPFLLFFQGLSLTNASQGSFIHKTMFIWVTILAGLFLKEKIDKKFLIGGLILLSGILILLKKLPHSFNYGDLLVFFATLLWAIENTISKYVLKSLEGRIVAWARMFFGATFILMFLLTTNQISLISGLTLKQISWVLITSIILFAYVITWYNGLKLIPVSQATTILLLGSPVTTLLSLITLQKITFQEISSSILVILGVIFIVGFKKTWQLFKETKLTYAGN